MQNCKNDDVVYHVDEVISPVAPKSQGCLTFFGTFQKTDIIRGVESLDVITAISHVLFEIPRKSQFSFIAHMTTQTSVVCCDAKYFATHTVKGKIHKIN